MALLLPEGQVLFGCSVMGHENADMFAFKDGQFLDGFDGKAMANSQMLPNHYIANDHGESNVYFRNVKIYDKSQKLISKFEVCIRLRCALFIFLRRLTKDFEMGYNELSH